MSYTAAQLTAIRSAIAKGELSVQFGDRRTQYRSIAELMEAEAHIAGALATTATARPKQYLGTASKGF